MNKTFLLIDTSHMLYRSRYVTSGDIWTQTGLALHIMLNSIKKCWQMFEADHVIFFLEGRSWRRSMYEPYKKNRDATRAAKSVIELEEDRIFNEGANHLINFIDEKTNCTVLQNSICEADDLIARWVQTHPDDKHVIVSGDTDFIQLLDNNIQMYDGVKNIIIRKTGVFDERDRKIAFRIESNGKLKILKEDKDFEPDSDWTDWALFVKIIRGDSSDNVFSAYPGVRIIKIRNAFEDRHDQGYVWNNLMLSRWTDHDKEDHRVRDCFERNQQLIDLTMQPDAIKETMDETIALSTVPKSNKQIGFHFLKFAGKYELAKIADYPNDFLAFLSAPY
ncbi:hypothetical protein LCGC14_1516110 [marine sediment metagenome]|uniref:5'-3' exonuclease domain-containing protein n=1 Tax=marine sediment metagenome TaxID=412755 RepID=A0A0F9M143_9ZZZZ